MKYFTVPRMGTGTGADPYRPDVPAGTSWVGDTSGTDYLIAVPDTAVIPAKTGRTLRLPRAALETAANARGRTYDDVLTWWVRP